MRELEKDIEKIMFFDELNQPLSTIRDKNANITKLFQVFDKSITKTLEDNERGLSIDDVNTEKMGLIQTYINLYGSQFGTGSKVVLDKEGFFNLVSNISPIKIGNKSKSIVRPPEFYKLFLSIFALGALILILFKYLPKSINYKKIFK